MLKMLKGYYYNNKSASHNIIKRYMYVNQYCYIYKMLLFEYHISINILKEHHQQYHQEATSGNNRKHYQTSY